MDRPPNESSCLICEAWALGDLCPVHQAMAEREPLVPLEKLTPPKDWSESGHATPDWLWTVALLLFIFFMLERLGVFR